MGHLQWCTCLCGPIRRAGDNDGHVSCLNVKVVTAPQHVDAISRLILKHCQRQTECQSSPPIDVLCDWSPTLDVVFSPSCSVHLLRMDVKHYIKMRSIEIASHICSEWTTSFLCIKEPEPGNVCKRGFCCSCQVLLMADFQLCEVNHYYRTNVIAIMCCERQNEWLRELVISVRKYRFTEISQYFISQNCINIRKHLHQTVYIQTFMAEVHFCVAFKILTASWKQSFSHWFLRMMRSHESPGLWDIACSA